MKSTIENYFGTRNEWRSGRGAAAERQPKPAGRSAHGELAHGPSDSRGAGSGEDGRPERVALLLLPLPQRRIGSAARHAEKLAWSVRWRRMLEPSAEDPVRITCAG